jgi:hypothetical protein
MSDIPKYVDKDFKILIVDRGFRKINEIDDGRSYAIDLASDNFTIKLSQYYREIYATLYKTGIEEDAVSLFNLLGYLHQSSKNVPQFNSFSKETTLDESLRRQVGWIADCVITHFNELDDFFRRPDLPMEMERITKYMKAKYPELFGGT